MKINKSYTLVLALALVFTLAIVGCTPTNDTGMTNRNRLTTQTRLNDWDNSGTNNGIFDDGLGLNDGMNMDNLNNGMTRPRTSNNSSTNFGNMGTSANEIAEKISQLPEVDRASVVISDDTAIVGCSLRGNTQGTMTNALRQKIRGIVNESVDIDNVSITTDPDMTSRIRNMSTSILQGNPVEEFAEDIRELIRDITPNTNINNNMMR
ncbi:MAG TPA: YhcN/YlaJ family sporulation lipoprotein [Tissierellaceae bacterium]|nr:YhcN/YlaJ family sporulation lipoprotein [Tissierellaceae bacterium]